MFVDEARVSLKAGRGGNGCASFRREKFVPRGGPDGGDGGSGGDVVLICDENIGDLTQYYYRPQWAAQCGEFGKGSQKTGFSGKDLELLVPPGTIVYNLETNDLVTELLNHGEKVILLKGGKGGLGNIHFKSSIHQAPRECTPGEEGEYGDFRFELKTLADIGLVGFPNAGKSTLLNAITDSRRKTAPYPFTTINPSVGVIHYPEIYARLKMADIPGLIEGASSNRGLGHRFLKHIERCKLLVIIVDMAGTDGRDPLKDYEVLLEELNAYSPALLEKPRMVAANKMDEPAAAENLARFKKRYPKIPAFPLCCVLGEGLESFKQALWDALKE
ncbi:MAG: GTPase ObgE [Verrucomicrobia bacterium 21-51-4]|nr:MAG: GTPase ObgE [Verrucomicrobia bacterium 21-51-4]HQU08857.1 GTPase ObgE [Opitutales bacterium]